MQVPRRHDTKDTDTCRQDRHFLWETAEQEEEGCNKKQNLHAAVMQWTAVNPINETLSATVDSLGENKKSYFLGEYEYYV